MLSIACYHVSVSSLLRVGLSVFIACGLHVLDVYTRDTIKISHSYTIGFQTTPVPHVTITYVSTVTTLVFQTTSQSYYGLHTLKYDYFFYSIYISQIRYISTRFFKYNILYLKLPLLIQHCNIVIMNRIWKQIREVGARAPGAPPLNPSLSSKRIVYCTTSLIPFSTLLTSIDDLALINVLINVLSNGINGRQGDMPHRCFGLFSSFQLRCVIDISLMTPKCPLSDNP